MSFELNVLGDVEARQDGREVPLGPPQRRAVLGLLAVAPGHSLTVAELITALWGDAPPSTALTALQVHVHHLRRALGDADDGEGGPQLLTRLDPVAAHVRYELRIAYGVLDLERFRSRHLQGVAAQAVGDRQGAQAAFAAAEKLWRGQPLAELPASALVLGAREDLHRIRFGPGGPRPDPAPQEPGDPGGPTAEANGPFPGAMNDGYTFGAQARGDRRGHRRPAEIRRNDPRAHAGDGLRFAVLGPVRAWRGDQPIGTGAPQQRALLAALLLADGRAVTASELLDAVWGDQPPNTALAALRSYAFRLRKALGPDALVTDSGGYALHVAPDALDLSVAERLAAEAERLRVTDPLWARQLLVEALELWHGEPLAGLPGPHAETHRIRLMEWHIGLVEARFELDLELGAHTEAVSELTALSAEHPLRERLRALLMLALYRSGRQAEALGVYADTRRLLADELGIDPSAELTDLHQRILEADPTLAPPPDTTTNPAETVRPAQLPATVADFTGRAAVVHELGEQLAAASQGSGIMAVSSVAGIGGVGKTTLAVHLAHAARDAFPDGQLYVDLQGTGPRPANPDTVLTSFLLALGVPASAIPESSADKAALYRSTLDGRRVLALLDNAYDAAQIRQLLPGTTGCAALVTSRVRMVDLAGAHLVDLDVMSPEEALQLFGRIVGEERVSAERQAALAVVGACGFLPLAIRIAASRLAARRTWTVSVLARKLADHRRRLDELRAGDLAVKATFALGYGHLPPHQARAFRLLSLPEGPDIPLPAAAAVLGLDPYAAEELLEDLVDISLIESAAPGRYGFHDLLRLYARECADTDDTPEERNAALSRLLDFYLATAVNAHRLENPGGRALDHLAATTHPGLRFTARDEALEWLFSEAQGLLAAATQTTAGGHDGPIRQAVDLLLATQELMESGVHVRGYEKAARALIAASQEAHETVAEGRARLLTAQLLVMTGRFAEADQEMRWTLVAGLAGQDSLACNRALDLRGVLARHDQRYDDCLENHRAARKAFRADDDRYGEASALGNIALAQVALGDSAAAVVTAEQAVTLLRELRAGFRIADGLGALGVALTAAGRTDEALDRLTEALGIFREARQPFREGITLFRLAKAHLTVRQYRQAASHAEQALIILRDVGGEWRIAHALTLLGLALSGLGQSVRANACWHDALDLHTSLGSPEVEEVRRLLGPVAAPASAVTV